MKEIVAVCREFKRNYDGSSEEDQAGLRLKMWSLGMQGFFILLIASHLLGSLPSTIRQNGIVTLVPLAALVLAFLLAYRGLSFLCRKMLEE